MVGAEQDFLSPAPKSAELKSTITFIQLGAATQHDIKGLTH